MENLIDQIQNAKDNGLCVVNVDEDKGYIHQERDNDKDIVFIPNECISPPIFTKVCDGSCGFSEGCAVIEQDKRRSLCTEK